MLVAKLGPVTDWQGREIIWDLDHFIPVGHDSITPDAVLDSDRQGFLLWASPELRPRVVSCLSGRPRRALLREQRRPALPSRPPARARTIQVGMGSWAEHAGCVRTRER